MTRAGAKTRRQARVGRTRNEGDAPRQAEDRWAGGFAFGPPPCLGAVGNARQGALRDAGEHVT